MSFDVHPGHAFEGFQLVDTEAGDVVLVARCECGTVLDVATAAFRACPECDGRETACVRCAGTGRVVDHAELAWRAPTRRLLNEA
jgi:hypothetical protein